MQSKSFWSLKDLIILNNCLLFLILEILDNSASYWYELFFLQFILWLVYHKMKIYFNFNKFSTYNHINCKSKSSAKSPNKISQTKRSYDKKEKNTIKECTKNLVQTCFVHFQNAYIEWYVLIIELDALFKVLDILEN